MGGPPFVRFRELGPEHVNRDLQIHTCETDGEATIPQIVTQAEALGLEEIAFTEHVRRTSDYVEEFVNHVRRARELTNVRVYAGFEIKVTDERGTLDASPETLARAELVLGSVHRFPTGDGQFLAASHFSYAEASQRELTLALGLLREAPIQVLAHPGGMCQRAFGKFPSEYFETLMQASLERQIAMEINTSYTCDLDGFLALCRKVNPFVSIGSDVHRLSDLGTCRNALWSRGIGCRRSQSPS